MGSASSTNVKAVQIRGTNEEREKRPHSRQRASSASSRKSITSAASERIRSSLGSRSSLEKEGPAFHSAQTGNDAVATKSLDEIQARLFQRQISALEMRNHELSEEVHWLRGQVCRVPQSILEKPDNEDYQQRCEELKEQLKSIREEKAREKERYEATIRTVHTEALSQVRDMHQKYELVQQLNARLEDTIKERLGASLVKLMREQMNQENRVRLEKMIPKKKEMSRMASVAEVSVPQMEDEVVETKKRCSEPIITFLPTSKTTAERDEVLIDEEEDEKDESDWITDVDNVYTLSEQRQQVKMVRSDLSPTYNPPPYRQVMPQVNSDSIP